MRRVVGIFLALSFCACSSCDKAASTGGSCIELPATTDLAAQRASCTFDTGAKVLSPERGKNHRPPDND